MRTLTVWAPYAEESVDAVIGTEVVPMTPGERGWWSCETEAGPGARYGFSVDGRDARPDPRSLSQPDGVHAASQIVDLDALTWTDAEWRGFDLADAVLYELHVGSFTPEGTLDSAIERLPELVDLGIDAVELMPLAAFPGRRGWGYDGVDLFAVHEPYGGVAALARFVDAAHAAGLGVVLDVVYNHLGPSGNYLGVYGPYFLNHAATPWGAAANLDQPGSDEVRRFFLDNARMWLRDLHVDGLRLDAVHALIDTRATHLLEEMTQEVDDLSAQLGRPLWLIAESDRNDPATVSPRGPGGAGGQGLHAQWADDAHHTWHVLLTGESSGYYADFAGPRALERLTESPFFHDGSFSTFRGRAHGRAVDPAVTDGSRFVVSTQTHDQVGNRAVGERLVELAGMDKAAIGAALMLTSPYVPMLFMGEEWGAATPWLYFTDHQEEALGLAIREGRAREFGAHGWEGEVPDPQDPASLDRSLLRWSERDEPDHAAMLDWYRTLIRLRKERPALRDHALLPGATEVLPDGAAVITRGDHLVAVNPGGEPSTVVSGSREVLAAWGAVTREADRVTLPAGSAAVLGPVAEAR